MKDGTVRALCKFVVSTLLASAASWAPPASAQTPAPADAPPMAAPPPAAPPPTPPAVQTETKPPTATESMPATRPEALPPISVGAWTRVSGIFQNATDPKKVNDWHMDSAYVELHVGGKVHKNVGVTLNLNGNASAVSVEDAIISFDFVPEFHVWGGHLLVPVDRANASGPFFMIPWNYPGLAGAGPHEGPSGRNNGVVVWGDVNGGQLTYLAGVFDDAKVTSSPLYSGRLRLALLDPEPGFWGNGSYFGDKDLLSIGVGAQYQKHGSADTMAMKDKDYADINADILFEKKIPGGGWFTLEGAYYHFNVLDGAISDALYGLLAYASPTVGVGNLQPMIRYQWEKVKSGVGTNPWNIDGGLSYLVKGPALRVVLTYSHNKLTATQDANSIQLGAQAIFF